MTIVEAIKKVLLSVNKSLTYKEIYEEIITQNLYSFKAKSPESIVNTALRRHCYGLDFPSSSPVKHFIVHDKQGNITRYSLPKRDFIEKNVHPEKSLESTSMDKLPEEKLQDAYLEHRNNIKSLLLENLLSTDPAFFESLVVDLLLKMGYGGNFPNAGLVSGSPGDGGIDGIIKEDKLGLDKIYIQAKRFTNQAIGRPDLQRFVGAMENVQKGVFITTSSFSRTAREYVEKQQKSIILIDGEMLSDLMLSHGVGVSSIRTYTTFKIDNNYFSDGL